MGMETLIPAIVTGGVVLKFSEAALGGGQKPRVRTRRNGRGLVSKKPAYPSRYSPF